MLIWIFHKFHTGRLVRHFNISCRVPAIRCRASSVCLRTPSRARNSWWPARGLAQATCKSTFINHAKGISKHYRFPFTKFLFPKKCMFSNGYFILGGKVNKSFVVTWHFLSFWRTETYSRILQNHYENPVYLRLTTIYSPSLWHLIL